MLVLSRERDEVIVFILEDGREIEVEVVDIRGPKVRLGVTADREIAVHRLEVWEAIQRENRAAGLVVPTPREAAASYESALRR